MLDGFLFSLLFKSMFRNKMIVSLIVINLTISLIVLSLIFSMFNAGYKMLNQSFLNGENIKIVSLQSSLPLEQALDLRSQWEDENVVSRVAITTFYTQLVQGEQQSDMVPIFGADQDYFLLSNINVDTFKQNMCVITTSVAMKFFGSDNLEEVVGKNIQINGENYEIVGLDTVNTADRLYIPYEQFLTLSTKPYTKEFFVELTPTANINEIKMDIQNFGPNISDYNQNKQQNLTKFSNDLALFTALGILLLLFSIVSFIQLYTYKILNDRFKWKMLFIFGALRKSLIFYIFYEVSILVLVSFCLSIVGYYIVSPLLEQPNFPFEFDLFIFLILFLIIFISILIVVKLSIQQLKKQNFL